MCGISALLVGSGAEAAASPSGVSCEELEQWKVNISHDIARRGNSDTNSLDVELPHGSSMWLCASVLHIQGDAATAQPVVDSHGNILLWNGEVFGGLTKDSLFHHVGGSDTALVSSLLERLASSSREELLSSVCSLMAQIRGPFAFVYYSSHHQCIIYGRDPFGRRSLLRLEDSPNLFGLSSVIPTSLASDSSKSWIELNIDGLYLQAWNGDDKYSAYCPWPSSRVTLTRQSGAVARAMRYGSPALGAPHFLEILRSAVSCRVQRVGNIKTSDSCPVGVLFSGGIDSVVLAVLLHEVVDSTEHIDLLNVTFEDADAYRGNKRKQSPSPDRLAAVAAHNELQVTNIPISSFLFIL